MTKKLSTEQIDRLAEIKDQIIELLDEANRIVRNTSEEGRAHSYWYAHARMAMDEDHSYLGGSGCTMQESIDSLSVGDDDDEEDDGTWAAALRANR